MNKVLEEQKLPNIVKKISHYLFLALASLCFVTLALFFMKLVDSDFDLEEIDTNQFGVVFAFLFIFAIIAAFLPQLKKLKVGPIELEKEVALDPTVVVDKGLVSPPLGSGRF